MGLGALGAIAGGINRGMDWAQRDQEIADQRKFREEDREYQRGLRNFQQGQQQRTLDDQGRQDKLAADLAAIKPAGTEIEVSPGYYDGNQDVPPIKKTQTDIAVARQQSKAYSDARQYDKAAERWNWADEAASKAAANAVIGRLSSLPRTGTDLRRIVQEIGAGVDADESPIGIDYKNVRQNEDGTVTVKAFNKKTGYGGDMTIRSIDDLKEKLTWHYAPEYAQARAAERAKLEAEMAKENTKPVNTPAGGITTLRNPDGTVRQTIRNDTGFEPTGEIGADGQPILRRTTGGSSSNGGKAPKVDDPLKPADDAWEFVSTKGEVRLQPEELATGRRMTRSIAQTGVDPATAAEVAITVMRDPKKGRLEINSETGTIDMIFRDPKINGGRAIAISQSAGTLKDLEGSVEGGAATVRNEVSNMVASIYGDNAQRMIEIAANPELSKQYLQSAQERGLDTTAVANRLNLIRNYLAPAAKPDAGTKPGTSKTILDTVRSGFGMRMPSSDPNSPAGRFQARQQDAAKQAEAKKAQAGEQQAQLSTAFKNDLSTMDRLEFVRKYDAIRSRLSAQDAAELRRIENRVFSTK